MTTPHNLVPLDEAKALLAATEFKNEAQFSEHIRRFCCDLSLLHYHTARSEHSPAGFPDWIIFAGDWGFALETKYGKNKATPDQVRWIAQFSRMPNWYAAVLYPDGWPLVRDIIIDKWEKGR